MLFIKDARSPLSLALTCQHTKMEYSSDVKKVPASGSWAAMVASNATAAAAQAAVAATAGTK